MSDQLKDNTEAMLPLEQVGDYSIRNGAAETKFHSKGISIRGPKVSDATENLADNGARLTIHSSHGARNSNYGEGLRLVVDTPQAKNMIAWYDGFSTPGRIKAKAWIGYHHGTYPDIVHDHISVETPNKVGELHTRFGISTNPSEVTNVDFNMADVQHTASQGGAFRLAVGGWRQTTYPRDLIFATGIDHARGSRRWALRADTSKESGGNVGSMLRLVRYSDSGTQLSDSTFTATRSNGHIGIGSNPDISWRVNIESEVAGLRLATTTTDVNALLRLEAPSTVGTVLGVRKPEDSQDRFRISTAGKLEWSSGEGEPDVNLRRTVIREKPVLGTNVDLYFDQEDRGPVLRSPKGRLYRLGVSDRGSLYMTRL